MHENAEKNKSVAKFRQLEDVNDTKYIDYTRNSKREIVEVAKSSYRLDVKMSK